MLDAQGQTYRQWCREADFPPNDADAVWDPRSNALVLASRPGAPPPVAAAAAVRAAADSATLAVDAFGTWARLREDAAGPVIEAGGAGNGLEIVFTAAPGSVIHDIAPAGDGWLLIALSAAGVGRLVIHDLLGRFANVILEEADFQPDRIAASGNGRIWIIDRGGRQLRLLAGAPLQARSEARLRAPHVFQAVPLNADPPRLTTPPIEGLGALPEIIDAVALPDGRLALLAMDASLANSIHIADASALGAGMPVAGLSGACSAGLLDANTLAFLTPGAKSAAAAEIPAVSGTPLHLLGNYLPLRNGAGGRFCQSAPGEALAYPFAAGGLRGGKPYCRLAALSRPSLARQGAASLRLAEADTERHHWRRLYIEAVIPPGCSITLRAAAGEDLAELQRMPLAAMHAHEFGETNGSAGPRGVWYDFDSEIAFRRAATGKPRQRGRCGLFSVLLQKSAGVPRRLEGRFLRAEIELRGNGLATPAVHAIRVWGGQQSWRERYLPEFMTVADGPLAEGSDFLDRYLGIIESLLTPLEDEVGESWRLTRPASAPVEALDWIASWIGAELDNAMPDNAKRLFLAEAVALWRRRGTLSAIKRMLDIATEGGIARGELVVLEHFHLRRTFSTILGLDLSGASNPLTGSSGASGNSMLGQTFFLGRENEASFLALFGPQTGAADGRKGSGEEAAINDFLDAQANRATVLVHSRMNATQRGLIARILERETPAHVAVELVQGPGSLVLALSSLLAVDTSIHQPPPKQDLSLGRGRLGQVWLTDAASLDPRMEGA